tara:strand:- start:234 stop:842 length:609 start_codon:yes stop_codon:yes gene_type:complete
MAWGNYRLKGYENFYKTLVGGNPFFEYQKKKYSDVKKDLKSILLVSDGHLTRQDLQELASYLSSNLQNYKIYYKLRPEEYDNFELLYKEILNENKNLNIINSDDPGLYYFLKKSNYVIGTNSTVLIEALPLSNVIIYEKGWFFEMEDYVNNELMFSFKTKENILDFILNGNADDINPNVEIFAENSISSMNQITKNIISKRK